jgi:hypothetical protein
VTPIQHDVTQATQPNFHPPRAPAPAAITSLGDKMLRVDAETAIILREAHYDVLTSDSVMEIPVGPDRRTTS